MVEAWAKCFQKLASPSDHGYDCSFAQVIEEQYKDLCIQPLNEFTKFIEEEMREVILSLKLNKSASPDGIESEHLRYGGETLILLLICIFSAIILSGYIPQSLCHGLVIPIPKGVNKDLSNPSNYRGITILSNISKALEKLLLFRISELETPSSPS